MFSHRVLSSQCLDFLQDDDTAAEDSDKDAADWDAKLQAAVTKSEDADDAEEDPDGRPNGNSTTFDIEALLELASKLVCEVCLAPSKVVQRPLTFVLS